MLLAKTVNVWAIELLLLFLSVRRKECKRVFPVSLARKLAGEFGAKVQGSLAQLQMFLLIMC